MPMGNNTTQTETHLLCLAGMNLKTITNSPASWQAGVDRTVRGWEGLAVMRRRGAA
jgi:hypothetical protein